jgi:hypothetical protein
MPSPVMSFEEFVEQLRSSVPARIQEENKKVESELPEIIDFKPQLRQRSMLLNPKDAQAGLKGMIEKQGKVERFLDVVSAVRGEKVEITEVLPGHRDDGRDVIMRGRNPETGTNVEDLRILLGMPERKGADIRNEVTQAAFYKALNLHVYRERANLN